MNKVFSRTGTKGKGKGTVRVTRPAPGSMTTGGAPQLNGRTASFVWCHWGDNALTTMGQDTMRLKKAMEGYDHKVLMKHNQTPSFLDFSEADERMADVMMPPTPQNFTDQLVRLAQEGYIIDVYIFSHGWSEGFWASNGNFHQEDYIRESRIRDLPSDAGLRALPIRAVYQAQCYAADLNAAWCAAGAKISVGARTIQYYPVQFKNFIKDWNKGDRFSTAATQNVGAALRTAAQAYMLAEATATKNKIDGWNGCPFGKTVLGNHSCAKDFHSAKYLGDDWVDGKSGKENMNYASTMILRGNRSITKNSRNLSW